MSRDTIIARKARWGLAELYDWMQFIESNFSSAKSAGITAGIPYPDECPQHWDRERVDAPGRHTLAARTRYPVPPGGGRSDRPDQFVRMTPEIIDPTNPVVALCAEGMAIEGTPAEARALFERAWAARRDDYDAAIAAHFLARHQATPEDTLHWNALAVRHAEAVPDGRTAGFLASLYLNLADAHANVGDLAASAEAVRRAAAHLSAVPPGGYREFMAMGIRRLAERVGAATSVDGEAR